jgi:hypothetical protein
MDGLQGRMMISFILVAEWGESSARVLWRNVNHDFVSWTMRFNFVIIVETAAKTEELIARF